MGCPMSRPDPCPLDTFAGMNAKYIFGYAFRKSMLETGVTFDDIVLTIEDASNYTVESLQDGGYEMACQFFGKVQPLKIREFPKQRGV